MNTCTLKITPKKGLVLTDIFWSVLELHVRSEVKSRKLGKPYTLRVNKARRTGGQKRERQRKERERQEKGRELSTW